MAKEEAYLFFPLIFLYIELNFLAPNMSSANSNSHTLKKRSSGDRNLLYTLVGSWGLGILGVLLLTAFISPSHSVNEWKLVKDIRFQKLSSLASKLLLQADYGGAIKLFEEALPFASSVEKRLKTLGHLGMLHAARNQHQASVSIYREALSSLEPQADQASHLSNEAELLQGLGETFAQIGKWDSASTYFQKSLSIYQDLPRELREQASMAKSLHGVGRASYHLNRTELAKTQLMEALEIIDSLQENELPFPTEIEQALIYSTLGEVNEQMDQLDQAEAHHLQAYTNLRAALSAHPGSVEPQLAKVLYRRGIFYLNQDMLEAANATFEESFLIYQEKMVEQPEAYRLEVANLALAQGVTQHFLENPALAESYFLRAKAQFEHLPDTLISPQSFQMMQFLEKEHP